MDFRQLRYFVTLAETLHFHRAAERLHITQPALSRQIAGLEARLGTTLFERHSRAVMLTAAGRRFRREAVSLLEAADRAVRATRAAAHGAEGELSIGFTMYAAWNVLPRLVKRFGDAHNRVDVGLAETLPRDLFPALDDGRIDVGISFLMSPTRALRYRALLREPLCVVLPHHHRLADQARISAEALAEEPFVTLPQATAPALHAAVIACCRSHAFEPRIRLETHLQQTIVNLVAAGLGVSIVPVSLARMRLDGAVFRPLTDAPVIEQGMYWRRDNANPCLGAFLEAAPSPSDDVIGDG